MTKRVTCSQTDPRIETQVNQKTSIALNDATQKKFLEKTSITKLKKTWGESHKK